jgi:hypothetical protein
MTKNTTREIHDRHSKRIKFGTLDFGKEDVKQDRSVVEYARGTNSTILQDQSVTPTTARVVESLDKPTGSPVVVLESREPRAPKVASKEAEKVGYQSSTK